MSKYTEIFNKTNSEVDRAYEEILKLQKGDVQPITTGLDFLDANLIGGLNNKMVFIGSRPSMGKTHNSAQIQNHLLDNFPDIRILRMNLEMQTQALLLRELKKGLNKPMKLIISQEFNEEEAEQAKQTLNKFKDKRVTDFSHPVKGEDLRDLLRAFYISCKEENNVNIKKVVILDHLHVYSSKEEIDSVLEIFNEVKMADPNISFIVYFQFNRNIEDEWRNSKEKKMFNFNMLPSSKFIYLSDKLIQYADIVMSITIPQVVDLEVFASINKKRNSHLKDHFIEESRETDFAKLKGLNRVYYNFIKIRMNDDFDEPRLFCKILDDSREESITHQYSQQPKQQIEFPDIDFDAKPVIDLTDTF